MSSERSGSNLLRVLLGNHSHLQSCPSPHFLKHFLPLIPQYSDLSNRQNALALFEDMSLMVQTPQIDWNVSLDFEAFYREEPHDSLLDFFEYFYRQCALSHGKKSSVIKENKIFDHARVLFDYYSTARVLYLYRDPRDYVASWQRLSSNSLTPYQAAQRWEREQQACESAIESMNLRVCRISYESLISDTERTLSNILSHIGEPIEPRCFTIDPSSNQHLIWNDAWRNISTPIIRDNSGQFKKQLHADTISMIETITRCSMARLGYTPQSKRRWEKHRAFSIWEKIHSKLLVLRRRTGISPTHRFLRGQERIIKQIHKRRSKNASTIPRNIHECT